MSPVDLEDLVRYVGLTVSLVGAFVVSPTAAVDLVRRSRTAVLAAARRAAGYLGLVTPTPQNVSVGSGIGLTSGVGTVTATSNAWIENDTLEQKIERLRNRIDGIDEQLRQTREEMRADKQAAQQALNEARG